MEYSTNGSSKKNKAWVEECKKVIFELNDSLTIQKNKNQQLQEQVQEMEKVIKGFTSREKDLRDQIVQLEGKLKEGEVNQSKKVRELSSSNEALQKELEQTLKILDQRNKNYDELLTVLKRKQGQIEQFERTIKKFKNQLSQAHLHINFLKNELGNLRIKINNQETQYLQENEKLKDLNIDLKKQFAYIQKQYDSALRESKDSSFSPTTNVFSTERIYFNPSKDFEERGSSQPKKIKQVRVVNPEMSGELKKIKKEIANQYNRLNETRETVLKERVSQTLSNIQIVLTDMSSRFQEDTSAYE